MRASLEWLREYVDIDVSAEELAEKLTASGIAVEGVEEVDGDRILVLELTPNRGDCYGMLNLAREVAAVTGRKVRVPQIALTENQEDINDYVRVRIEAPELCARYAARLVKNVRVEPSPGWMQERLTRAGIRPINNIVDITNYVMLETNQPLHAFDYDLLKGRQIIVRRAAPGEKLVTLDEVERELDEEMLVIADSERAVALAGVMGGRNTEISDSTGTILLESANFLASSVRGTSRRLGLRTEASLRFEKGADVFGIIRAVDRAAQLITELGAGEVVRGVCDEFPGRREARIVELRPDRVNRLLGTRLSPESIRGYLENLGFPLEAAGDRLRVTVPSWRPDIELEADLIEEVARLHGYENIASTLPHGPVTEGIRTPWQRFRDRAVDVLARSLTEVVNYSFINPRYFDLMLLDRNDRWRRVVPIANPLSEEQSVMRTTLLPGILDTVSRNLARRNENLALFEVGAVFYLQEKGLPEEKLNACMVATGRTATNWHVPSIEMDFFYLKGILEDFLSTVGVAGWQMEPVTGHPAFHPGRAARIRVGEKEVGIIGEIHPLVRENFAIKQRACACELDLEMVFAAATVRRMTAGVTRYPAVSRDLAVLVPDEVPAGVVARVIQTAGGELLREIILFDVYKGAQIPAGYKSLAYSLTFQSPSETLTDEQVSNLMQRVLQGLEHSVGARLR